MQMPTILKRILVSESNYFQLFIKSTIHILKMWNLSETLYNENINICRNTAYVTATWDQQGLLGEGVPRALWPLLFT